MQRPLMSEWCTTTPFTSVLSAAAKKSPRPAQRPRPRKNPRFSPLCGREKIHGSPRPAAAAAGPRKETHGSLCPAAAAALESTVLPQSQLRNHPRFSPPRPQGAEKTHGSHRPAAAAAKNPRFSFGEQCGDRGPNARRQRFSLAAIPCRIYRISSDLRSQAAQGLVSTRVGDCLGTPSGAASFSPQFSSGRARAGVTRPRQNRGLLCGLDRGAVRTERVKRFRLAKKIFNA